MKEIAVSYVVEVDDNITEEDVSLAVEMSLTIVEKIAKGEANGIQTKIQ